MSGGERSLFPQQVQMKKVQIQPPGSEVPLINASSSCEQCSMKPLIGTVYKCNTCTDDTYLYCQPCYECRDSDKHDDHEFTVVLTATSSLNKSGIISSSLSMKKKAEVWWGEYELMHKRRVLLEEKTSFVVLELVVKNISNFNFPHGTALKGKQMAVKNVIQDLSG